VTRTDPLVEHLEDTYGIAVAGSARLDEGVHRIDRRDGASWVARVFPAARPLDGVEGDAAVLRALEPTAFPAECLAHEEAVSTWEGQGVLVTEYVESAAPLRPGRPAAILGVLLSRLHRNPGEKLRAGGAWHHLSYPGGPREEVAAATQLLEDALPRVGVRELALYDQLCDAVQTTDDCHDLPHAFVHPDLVPANAIPTPDGHLVIVDWAGAGRGPRLWSLGFLLWAAGAGNSKLVGVVASRYRRSVTLQSEERAARRGRPAAAVCDRED
jgi:hypothetical protein